MRSIAAPSAYTRRSAQRASELEAAMTHPAPMPFEAIPTAAKPWWSVVLRFLLHVGFLAIALGCLAAYEHFAAEGQSNASIVSLVAAAGFGFLPLRDLARVVFRIGGTALHGVHLVGGLALAAIPFTGVVSGTSVLSHAALAPFSMMGAAQALMHSNQPRNAKQEAALRQFVASLPQIEQLAGPKSFSSPESAARAAAVLSDIVAKAQVLGETELDADPEFQGALRQVTTRFGAGLGLDAVDVALNQLAANPAMARLVPGIREQVTVARQAIAGAHAPTHGQTHAPTHG
jgi:hypothetical protein